jgi:stage II sporulation protein D
MMRCTVLTIMLLLIAYDVSAAVIPDQARVRILSSRHPMSAVITSSNGRLYLPEGIFICDKAEFRAVKGGIEIRSFGRKIFSQSCVYKTTESFTAVIDNQGQKVERTYSGSAEICAEGRELCIVNTLPFEKFVHDAACSESGELLNLPVEQRDEFFSAMEICVRSYLAAEKNRHGNLYQFCDLTHCVHYEGISQFKKNMTRGKVLEGNAGTIVRAYFHSACGGVLSGPEVFWDRAAADSFYRRGNDSAEGSGILCAKSPHASWNYFIKAKDMNALLGGNVSFLKSIESGGRVASLQYETDGGASKKYLISRFMSESGRQFGWNAIKSNYFTVKKKDEGWLFEGHGLGHGIGLCQYGAQELAKRGWSAQKILSFYFSGSKIVMAENK